MEQGSATLHPISERYLATGLEPGGDDQLLGMAVPDKSPDLLGPDAEGSIADKLRNPGMDQFHVVVELRSIPSDPLEIWPVPGDAFTWADSDTLEVTVDIGSWGSLDEIDDPERRQALESADELVHTGVWTLSPALENLPTEVTFSQD